MQPTLLSAAAALLLIAPPTLAQRSHDRTQEVLRVRASRAGPATGIAFRSRVGPGNRLFHMVGGDNAECVRAVPDVNGDGRDEIVVGIGESGTDNVFCLDGASTAAATVVWSIQTADGVSGGSVWGDQAIVPVSDSEGSGDANVLVGTAWGGRTAYSLDTAAGAEVLKYDTYLDVDSGWVYSLCEMGDVTGDLVTDFAFGAGSDSNAVYLVDGASPGPQASLEWRYPAGDAVYSVRNLGDVSADGKNDVLAAIGDDVDRIVCLEGDPAFSTGETVWTYAPGTSVYSCGVLDDVTGDGVRDALAVLWVSGGSAIRCLNGTNGAVVWTSTDVPDFGMAVDALGDVTGDGKPEVVVASWENAVIVLNGADGSLVWKTTVGTTHGGDVWTARAIDDLNGDGRQDVIAGSFDRHVYAMDGDNGSLFWAYDTGNRVFSVAPVGDLNGDGRPEVVAGTQDTTTNVVVHVLEGDAGLP